MKYLIIPLLFIISCQDKKCDHMGFVEDIQERDSLLWDLKTDTNKLKRYLEDQRYRANLQDVLDAISSLHGKVPYSVSWGGDSAHIIIDVKNLRPGKFQGEPINIDSK